MARPIVTIFNFLFLHLGTCEAIDIQARTNARRLMRLHKGFPNAILVAEAALGYTAMSMRKQQERLLNTLSDPDGISGLARDVLACTAHFLTSDHTGATPATEYKGPEFARPWVSTIEQDRRAYKQRGIHTLNLVVPQVVKRGDVNLVFCSQGSTRGVYPGYPALPQ